MMSSPSSDSHIPKTGDRSTLCSSISRFLESHSSLHLGGDEDFHAERRKHLEVFGFHNIPEDKQHAIGRVEFTAVRGPHGTIPVRVLYPKSGKAEGENGAWVYFHGGGYTVGSVDEFENGLRQVAEESGVQVHHIRNQEIREDEELI
jgi:acetyl esterase/lipase